MDNKIFNVNGRTKEQLFLTLKLALQDEYDGQIVRSWEVDEKKGLVLNWTDSRGNKFLAPPSLETLASMVWDWLHTEDAKKIPTDGKWDYKLIDSDVSIELGFRVYCEDWGHVGNNDYAIVAIKPIYCWYGK